MIRVLIERDIADDLADHYEKAARATLTEAMQAHGFISGEALHDTQNPNHRVVLATYRTIQDWQRWARSDQRQEAMAVINPMLISEEKITVLEH
ncbi:antibiotic biosynthesis monooxygenase family protein [Marinobacterium sedimentorum]|uniref:antibiotic biosynthesis monooxygenase family protein n=1 Tax=Marinobacterium sedimentorum TaxID=2927804 RepID=UPI0020C5ED31|nr:antibiotic biosynthesis monooxygenase [Marinobacterium sedimentorum]MCP8689290.1 antibiotic biosynthesis monooxygenase [Marinobacterium sedimentorum]